VILTFREERYSPCFLVGVVDELLCNVSFIVTMAHIANIPERKKIDPLAVIKDYAVVPRLEYR
jgi:hypothetical protein